MLSENPRGFMDLKKISEIMVIILKQALLNIHTCMSCIRLQTPIL